MPASICLSSPGRRKWARRTAALFAGAVLTVVAATQATAATNDLYVANLRGNSVSVVDPATNTVVATIPVGEFPEGAAVLPDGSQAWVTNNGTATVSVISTATNTVTRTIPVGRFPGPITFSPDGSHAYVGHFISPGIGGVAVIDSSTDAMVADVPVGNQPFSIAVTPDGSRAYSANFVGGSISVIDTATNTVTATISGSGMRTPTSIAITPDGSHAYVADFNANAVFEINTATNTVVAAIPIASGPAGVSITPDGTRVYVANENSNTVSVIDTATNTVTATIAVGSTPDAVLVSGTIAYVSNGGSNTVSVIDTTTNTVTSTVPVGATPFALAQAPTVLPPTVSGISPAHGPEAGGNTVTISGSHLIGTSQVLFGTISATDVTVVNDNTVTAVAPAQEDGTVHVTVTTAAGTSSPTSADQYTYDEPAPAITAISPRSGVIAGGTTVTITGTDFDGATAVSFGGTAATSFTVNSDTSITATAPPAAGIGTVDITVTTAAGTSALVPADQYSYIYPFSGFFAPVANPPTVNMVHAGQAIPIQFSLGGNFGFDILAAGSPSVQQVSCATGTPVNTSTETDTSGNSGLQYNTTTGTYTYVWKTDKASAGTCQVFTLSLNDGTSYTANFEYAS